MTARALMATLAVQVGAVRQHVIEQTHASSSLNAECQSLAGLKMHGFEAKLNGALDDLMYDGVKPCGLEDKDKFADWLVEHVEVEGLDRAAIEQLIPDESLGCDDEDAKYCPLTPYAKNYKDVYCPEGCTAPGAYCNQGYVESTIKMHRRKMNRLLNKAKEACESDFLQVSAAAECQSLAGLKMHGLEAKLNGALDDLIYDGVKPCGLADKDKFADWLVKNVKEEGLDKAAIEQFIPDESLGCDGKDAKYCPLTPYAKSYTDVYCPEGCTVPGAFCKQGWVESSLTLHRKKMNRIFNQAKKAC